MNAPAPARIIPSPPPLWASWEDVMEAALAEARLAESAVEVPVGALVLSAQGEILGRGHNSSLSANDPTAHAEIVAVRQAGARRGNYRLDGCILAVTLEPCLMCAGAISHARLAGVVFGAEDSKAGAVVSCLDAFDLPFLNHRPWHLGRIAEGTCAAVLREFFTARR